MGRLYTKGAIALEHATIFIFQTGNVPSMTSGTSRRLKVCTDEETASEALRKLWAGLPYIEKTIKIDRLPGDFWGTFRCKNPGTPIKRYNKTHFFAEVKPFSDGEVMIKVEVVIPSPLFGQGALEIVARCIFLLAKYFRRRSIRVESVWQLLGPNLII